LPREIESGSLESRMCLEMVQQPEVFARLIDLRPHNSHLWHSRGRLYAGGRQWAEASADFGKLLDLRTADESRPGFMVAPLRLLAGDDAGYRDLCTNFISKQAQIDDPITASALTRACTLTPSAVSDWSVPVRLAKFAVAKETRKEWQPWLRYALGVAQYRAGQHLEAIQTLEKSLDVDPAWLGRSQNYVVLAMACQQLGRTDEARDWLAKSRSALDEMNQTIANYRFGYAQSSHLSSWLRMQILLPEAEKLIAAGEEPCP